MLEPCPCHSDKPFTKCCQPFLAGTSNPRTVAQLMRSRFAAFALGNHGEYLFDTWHPAYRGNLTPAQLSTRDTDWTHLHIVDSWQEGNTGHVEFIATFQKEDGSEGTHHEASSFVREQGRWLYTSGDVRRGPDVT